MLPEDYPDTPCLIAIEERCGSIGVLNAIAVWQGLLRLGGKVPKERAVLMIGRWTRSPNETAEVQLGHLLATECLSEQNGHYLNREILDQAESMKRYIEQRRNAAQASVRARFPEKHIEPFATDGASTAAFIEALPHTKIKKAEFVETGKAAGLPEPDLLLLWNLCAEFSRPTVSHYVRTLSAYLSARGDTRNDFISYVKQHILSDRMEGRGSFANNNLKPSSGPAYRPAEPLSSIVSRIGGSK